MCTCLHQYTDTQNAVVAHKNKHLNTLESGCTKKKKRNAANKPQKKCM